MPSNGRGEHGITKYLGELIEQRRKELRMSQEYVAGSAGISRSYLSDIERGLRNISVDTLIRIARAIDTSASQLLNVVEKTLPADPNDIRPLVQPQLGYNEGHDD
jgi:XRE family transcriptional regulator, regulator of sulfur utilization